MEFLEVSKEVRDWWSEICNACRLLLAATQDGGASQSGLVWSVATMDPAAVDFALDDSSLSALSPRPYASRRGGVTRGQHLL